MIKLSEWDSIYRHSVDWALRVMEKTEDATIRQDWVNALFVLSKVQDDLIQNYAITYKSGTSFKKNCIKGFELDADQLFDLMHSHLRKYTNGIVRQFLFHLWNAVRLYTPEAQLVLGEPFLHFSLATKEEIDYANKKFHRFEEHFAGETHVSMHNFNKEAKVLVYRNKRFIIDDEWGAAWTESKTGKIKYFQLDWDWWYPIDKYLDLEECEDE